VTKRSVSRVAKRAREDDDAARAAARQKTDDSFVNFAAKVGVGTDNLSTGGSYGFNPITRNRQLLEWIHRGSWLGGVAVDLVADDMTAAGLDYTGSLGPDDDKALREAVIRLGIWPSIRDVFAWSRLYGGALGVLLIDGQDMSTPLKIDRITKGQFKGILVLDRWMVEPSLSDLITDMGPNMGLPKYYRATANAPGLPLMKIHHTRCMRAEGVRLPYWQRLAENMWGLSVIERLFDRMIAFDSATQGAAQLVYKAYLRTVKVEDLRKVIAAGGDALAGLVQYVQSMSRFQAMEGMTLLDAKDDFAIHEATAFSGLSDALVQFGQQLSGALQIPLVRLFGQSPAGMNSSGDSDLRTYYDGIRRQQERHRVEIDTIHRVTARSEGILLPEDWGFEFRYLGQMTEPEKASTANNVTTAVTTAFEQGIVPRKTALQELRKSSRTTGIWSNISDEEINDAEDDPPAPGEADPPPPAAAPDPASSNEPAPAEEALEQPATLQATPETRLDRRSTHRRP
jgi:phage-related protein (TIGR01555 family)